MEKTLKFFKQDGCWYADVEGHTLAENQMVAGSDKFLESVNHILGNDGIVNITISNEIENAGCMARLAMISHNQWGATYVLGGPVAKRYNAEGFKLWICNVTHDVLGEHPRTIYIKKVC